MLIGMKMEPIIIPIATKQRVSFGALMGMNGVNKIMRPLLLALAILSLAAPCLASPYLVSDPATEATVDSCQITGDGFTLPCSLDATRAIHIDMATLTRGRSYTITAKFCVGGLWCSDPSVPFTFTAPEVGAPGRVRLSTQ